MHDSYTRTLDAARDAAEAAWAAEAAAWDAQESRLRKMLNEVA